jgi:hypothetical protein
VADVSLLYLQLSHCFLATVEVSEGDCPIRRFEHKAMLTFEQIGESWQLWPSFRAMMADTTQTAESEIPPRELGTT